MAHTVTMLRFIPTVRDRLQPYVCSHALQLFNRGLLLLGVCVLYSCCFSYGWRTQRTTHRMHMRAYACVSASASPFSGRFFRDRREGVVENDGCVPRCLSDPSYVLRISNVIIIHSAHINGVCASNLVTRTRTHTSARRLYQHDLPACGARSIMRSSTKVCCGCSFS